MAKGKKPSKRPQAQHKPKSRSSQHDKRKRLDIPNLQRKKTVNAKVPLAGHLMLIAARQSPEKCWENNFWRLCLRCQNWGNSSR